MPPTPTLAVSLLALTALTVPGCAADGTRAEDTAGSADAAAAGPSHRARRAGSPPTGEIVLDNPRGWVPSRTVTLGLTYADDTYVEAYCLSLTGRCTSRWLPIEDEVELTLRRTVDVQTVKVWFRDSDGLVSAPATATLRVDEAAPTPGVLTAAPVEGGAELRWSGFRDDTSRISRYRLVGRAGAVVPSCTTSSALLYEGADTSFIHRGQGPEPWAFRVCAIDAAGHMSVGASARATAITEDDPPVVSSFAINGGDWATTSRAVTLDSVDVDASGVSHICVTERDTVTAATCSPWQPYLPALPITLSGGEGEKRVRAWLRDRMGNVSAEQADGILFDRTAPADGAVEAEVEEGAFTLRWADFVETGSGIAGYRVAYALERAPGACAAGEGVTLLELGDVTTHAVTGLEGTRYGVRICGVDRAGNVGLGRTINLRLPLERVPPVLHALSSPACTADRDLTVHLDARDDSTITRMCVNEGAGCTAWLPFDPNPTVRLSGTPGTKQLVAMVRDEHGNESAMVSATVELRAGGDSDGDGYDVCSDCDDSDPDVHPGAVERLWPGDENCDGEADEAAVLFVTGWQCNSHGASIEEARARTASEAEALTAYLADMDLGMDRLDETPSGLPAGTDLSTYDLVLYSKCGWSWQSYNQPTVDAMLRAQATGTNTMVFEDDITFGNERVSGEEPITLLGQCLGNGTGLGTVTIDIDEASAHGAYRGPYGTPTDTRFAWDMDWTTEIDNGAEVIARHSHYGTPVWLAYEDPATGRRAVSMLFNFATANHGTVSDEEGLANLEMMFKNSFSWSLGLHD